MAAQYVVTPWLAVTADVEAKVVVTFNGLRLLHNSRFPADSSRLAARDRSVARPKSDLSSARPKSEPAIGQNVPKRSKSPRCADAKAGGLRWRSAVLQAIGLSKFYNGVRALDSLGLLIEQGQTTTINARVASSQPVPSAGQRSHCAAIPSWDWVVAAAAAGIGKRIGRYPDCGDPRKLGAVRPLGDVRCWLIAPEPEEFFLRGHVLPAASRVVENSVQGLRL